MSHGPTLTWQAFRTQMEPFVFANNNDVTTYYYPLEVSVVQSCSC